MGQGPWRAPRLFHVALLGPQSCCPLSPAPTGERSLSRLPSPHLPHLPTVSCSSRPLTRGLGRRHFVSLDPGWRDAGHLSHCPRSQRSKRGRLRPGPTVGSSGHWPGGTLCQVLPGLQGFQGHPTLHSWAEGQQEQGTAHPKGLPEPSRSKQSQHWAWAVRRPRCGTWLCCQTWGRAAGGWRGSGGALKDGGLCCRGGGARAGAGAAGDGAGDPHSCVPRGTLNRRHGAPVTSSAQGGCGR